MREIVSLKREGKIFESFFENSKNPETQKKTHLFLLLLFLLSPRALARRGVSSLLIVVGDVLCGDLNLVFLLKKKSAG